MFKHILCNQGEFVSCSSCCCCYNFGALGSVYGAVCGWSLMLQASSGWLEDLLDMWIPEYVRNQQASGRISDGWVAWKAWYVNFSMFSMCKKSAFRLGKSISDYSSWFKHQRLIPECQGACDRLQQLFVESTLYHLADWFHEIYLAQTNGLLCCWIVDSFKIEACKSGILLVKANPPTK